MIVAGKPWGKDEEDILTEWWIFGIREVENSFPAIQQYLLEHNFERSIGAIQRKVRRIDEKRFTKAFKQPETSTPKQLDNQIRWLTGDIPLVSGELTKFVMLNDVHVPHNIDLTNIFEFIKDFKPDYILLVGDIVNNDPFDHWKKAKAGTYKGMPQPKPYFEQCNKEFYRPLRKLAGNECKIIHWVGNHEYWSNKAIQEIPEGEGYWEVWNNVEGIDYWIPSKQIANLGKLHFIHGDIFQGKNVAQKALNYYRRNLRFGHFHNLEEASYTSPIDVEDRHTARCCGTLEKFNPDFMENRPHSWLHAFTYGVVFQDGTFTDMTIPVIKNRFYAEGKTYGKL